MVKFATIPSGFPRHRFGEMMAVMPRDPYIRDKFTREIKTGSGAPQQSPRELYLLSELVRDKETAPIKGPFKSYIM